MRKRGSPEPATKAPIAIEPTRAPRRLTRPSAGDLTSVLPRRHSKLAPLSLDLGLLGLREVESVLGRRELRGSGLGGGIALVVDALGQILRLDERAGALERGVGLGEARIGLDDLALRARDGGGRTRDCGVVLGDLRFHRLGDEHGQHVALLDAVALVHLELEDAQALDLRRDQDLLARDEGAGHEDGLDKILRGHRHDRDSGRQARHRRLPASAARVRDLLPAAWQ